MGGLDGEGTVGDVPVPMVVYDADGVVRSTNEAVVDALDAPARERVLGRRYESLFASDCRDEAEARVERVLAEREPAPPRELELRTVAGETWYAKVAAGPVTYDGDPAGHTVLQDVTDRRARERQLRAERDRFTALFEAVPEPVLINDFTGDAPIVRGVNPAFEETFGYDAEQAVGENVNDLIVTDDRMAEARDIDRAAADLQSVEREVRRETVDGELRDFLFRAKPLDLDERVEMLGIYVDITDRKATERDLAAERDRLRTLFEHLPNPVVHGEAVDGEPIIRAVNPAFEETFGYDAEQAVGENLDDLTVPEDRRAEARELNRRAHRSGRLRTEVRRETADGLRDFVLDAAMRDADSVEGYAIYTDITDRKARRRELERQNERLEEFAGVVSHDLRTPLSVATGNLHLYREDGDESHLDRVEESLSHMADLLEKLLTLAREGEAVDDTEPVDLATVARAAWQGIESADATLAVEADRTVEADPTRLREVFANLLRNAVEHGGDDVTVTVGALGARGFYVADDGPGIDPGECEAVFDPGYTTDEDGTGFGLAIVEDVAEAHGWTVDLVESDCGGARFEFRTAPGPAGG